MQRRSICAGDSKADAGSGRHNLATIYGDKIRLVEVDQNLLDNAAKFSTGTVQTRLEVGATGLDQHRVQILVVCDNGTRTYFWSMQ